LRAQDDGAGTLDDGPLLDRSTSLGRVMFSQDRDMLAEASLRQRQGVAFAGVIYGHQLEVTVGQCISEVACEVAKASQAKASPSRIGLVE
jgi:hypothetical protein